MPDLTKMSREEKRLWLAGMAMQGLLARGDGWDMAAHIAVRTADRLLKELEA